ncbi:hypothetical protein LINPERPRIM_LOCUS39672 [Linum perenne]
MEYFASTAVVGITQNPT